MSLAMKTARYIAGSWYNSLFKELQNPDKTGNN